MALMALAVEAAPAFVPATPPGWLERRAGPCVLVAPPEASRSLESLAGRAPRIVAEVSRALGIEPAAPYRMVLIPASGARDSDLVRIDRGAPAWAAGFMNPAQRSGAIRLGQAARYPYGTPEGVLAHESAHQLIHDAPGVELPLWFEEGAATWAAREWQFEDVFQLSSRLLTHALPSLDSLSGRFRGDPGEVDQAYAASFAFLAWSSERYGGSLVRDVLSEARTHPFERAWRLATGVALERSEREWRREALFRYRWLPVIAGSSTLWLIVLLISLWVWARRRARARALEATWDAEEAESAGEGVVEGAGEPWITEWRVVEPAEGGPPSPSADPARDPDHPPVGPPAA